MTAVGHRTSSPTDAGLLARAASGDEAAFRSVYERHAGAVHGYLVGRVGPDCVDDLLSETFEAAWRASARFDDGAASARPWLYGIATHVVARHREREARWIERIVRSPLPPASTDGPTAVDLDPALVRAIGTLSPALRDVLLLSALGELTLVEVAHALDIRPTTARVRLLRARRLARAALEGNDDD